MLNGELITGEDFEIEDNGGIDDYEVNNSFFIHRTRLGKSLLVFEMDDDHLLSTIEVIIKKLESLKGKITASKSKFMSMAYKSEVDMETLKEQIYAIFIVLHKYIMEAWLRGLEVESYKDRLKAVLDRND